MMRPMRPDFGDALDTLDAEHVAGGNRVQHCQVARVGFRIEAVAQGFQHHIGRLKPETN